MADHTAAISLAWSHANRGRDAEARALFLRVASGARDDARALADAARGLSALDEHAPAEHHARRAVARDANSAEAHGALGGALLEQRRFDEAIDAHRTAAALAPGDEGLALGLCLALQIADRYRDALDAALGAHARFQESPATVARLADTLCMLGRAGEAVDLLRDARERFPDTHALATDLCFASTFDPRVSAPESLEFHRAYGALVRRLYPSPPARPAPDPRAGVERPLRLAVVSPDLRRHPVATFFEPALARFDPARIETLVYSTALREDEVSARLRRSASRWARVPHRSAREATDELNRRIRADGADCLLELSGHSERHLLPLLRLAPAPLLVTGLGWPNTTGVEEADLRITDSLVDPPGTEGESTEAPLRLDPCFLCYAPLADAPEVGPLPGADPAQPITFGSFNAVAKLNDDVLALWARLLDRAPGARLVLKHRALTHEQGRRMLDERLAKRGVPSGRLELLGMGTYREHLDAYNRVDIGLDPFPFHGATTTCDALFMGVPVITLAQARIAARVGPSLLACVGLDHLVARSPEEYVDKAIALGADRRALAALRAGLRERIARSPLCDAAAYARRFEASLLGASRERADRARGGAR